MTINEEITETPKVEDIPEAISTDLTPSVARTNVEHISTSPQKENDAIANVRLDSMSSSSSSSDESESEKVSENMPESLPEYVPRKSSFSSPSEVEVDRDVDRGVVIFGEEPGESIESDAEKSPKKVRTNLSDSSESDSGSESEGSLHIDQPDFGRFSPGKNVRKDSQSSENEPNDEALDAVTDEVQDETNDEAEIRDSSSSPEPDLRLEKLETIFNL